jgi:DNA-binding NtrC family response regulator
VLEDGELERVGSSRTVTVDVRIISATNADLPQEVASGRFRKDLLFRLNTVEIRLPPLRERREDIVPMAEDFLCRCAQRYQRDGMRLGPSARRALEGYAWPGNVRELSHVIERAVLMASGDVLDHVDVSLAPLDTVDHSTPPSNMTLEQAEHAMVRNALDQCGGNIQKASEMLGVSRAALYRRLEKFGLRAD